MAKIYLVCRENVSGQAVVHFKRKPRYLNDDMDWPSGSTVQSRHFFETACHCKIAERELWEINIEAKCLGRLKPKPVSKAAKRKLKRKKRESEEYWAKLNALTEEEGFCIGPYA